MRWIPPDFDSIAREQRHEEHNVRSLVYLTIGFEPALSDSVSDLMKQLHIVEVKLGARNFLNFLS